MTTNITDRINRNYLVWTFILAFAIGLILFRFSPAVSQRSDSKLFLMKELGVAIEQPSELSDLFYERQKEAKVGEILWLTTSSLRAVSDNCYLGIFYKINKDDLKEATNQALWDESALRQAMLSTDPALPSVKEFPNEYLVFEPSQSVCSDGSGLMVKEAEIRRLLWRSVASARTI